MPHILQDSNDVKSYVCHFCHFVLCNWSDSNHPIYKSTLESGINVPLGLLTFRIKFYKISTLLLTTVHTVNSKVKILQNFSEYMNFTLGKTQIFFFWNSYEVADAG